MQPFRIRAMLSGDITDGLALKERAGWNQVRADWSRTLALQPDGCFVAELDNRVVGTVATCRFGPVGWVAMMLVDERNGDGESGRPCCNKPSRHSTPPVSARYASTRPRSADHCTRRWGSCRMR